MSDITTLAKVKIRCGIALADTTYDALLTFFIGEVARRFDRWTGRKLERTTGRTNSFPAESLSLIPDCRPVERVTKWELKSGQCAQLYQLRDKIGVSRVEITGGIQWSLADYVWVPPVRAELTKLRRFQYTGYL